MTQIPRPQCSAAKPAHRFLAEGDPAAVLVGRILCEEAGEDGTFVQITHDTDQLLRGWKRAELELLAPLQPWNSAVAAMEGTGANEGDLKAMVSAGLVLRLPGSITPEEFGEVFTGLGLYGDTRLDASTNGITANLKIDGQIHTVDQRIFELLTMSMHRADRRPWLKDLPTTIDLFAYGSPQASARLISDLVRVLAVLINNGIVSLMRVSAPTAAPAR